MLLTYEKWKFSEEPDFVVYWTTEKWGKHPVGRVRPSKLPIGEVWEFHINPPMPIPSYGRGYGSTKEEALQKFSEAFTQFVEQRSDADFERAWRVQGD